MFIPRKVKLAFAVFDVLSRADAEYVPPFVIERFCDGKVSVDAIQDVCAHLRRHGILKGRLGRYGGYKHVKPVTLLELMEIFTPSRVPDPLRDANCKQLASFVSKVNKTMASCVIKPKKIVPLDYVTEDDDVETASMEAHGPKEGPPY